MIERLGRYKIEDLLGEGSFAWVYRALDEELERYVALKVLKPAWLSDRQALGRFKQEARTMANLHHPHIAVIYEVGEAEGQVYLAQFLVDGESLAARLARSGALPWPKMLAIIRPVAAALDYAHAQGIVHRDIKPSNIMLDKADQPYLGDFGLVRAAEGSASLSASAGGLVGTPAYMAPEQWEGQPATPTTDVYALSCVVVELLTGRLLFDGSTPAVVMKQHLLEGPRLPEQWPSDVPASVTAVLQRGLAEKPAERIGRAGELVTALAALSAPAPAATLELVRADGQRFAVQPGTLTLGRARDNDIPLDDRAASRVHATLEYTGQSCTLYDEGSANGTFVNGRPVGQAGQPLQPGDEVRIGETIFTLRQGAAAPLPAPPPVGPAARPVDAQAATTIIPAAVLAAARAEIKAEKEPVVQAQPAPVSPPLEEAAPPEPAAEAAPPQAASKAGLNKGLFVGCAAAAVVVLALVGGVIFWALGPVPTPTPAATGTPVSVGNATPTDTPESADAPTSTHTPTPTESTNIPATYTPVPIYGGNRILFHSKRDSQFRQIYVMNEDGTNITRLTNKDATGGWEIKADDSNPAWSPDGERIAYDSSKDGKWEIYVMNADGSNPTRLTNDEFTNRFPYWLPDGQHIIYDSRRNDSWVSYVIDADGTNLAPVTGDYSFGISPNGQYKAFVSEDSRLYIENVDGTDQRILTTDVDVYGSNFAWSPDSRRIVFTGRGTHQSGSGWHLYVINIDGTNLTLLTNHDAEDLSPAWGGPVIRPKSN